MRKYVVRVLGVGLCAGAVVYSVWPPRMQANVPASPDQAAAQGRMPVRAIRAGERVRGDAGEKGGTYYSLAGRTKRLTTRFAHAVAVAEPAADGDIQATLSDAAGNEIARLHVDRWSLSETAVQFARGAHAPLQVRGEPHVKMTMHWANQQVYAFYADGVESADADVEWVGEFVRRRGAASRRFEGDIVELQCEWENGLKAVTTRQPAARRRPLPDREFTGALVATRLTKDGIEVGRANYFPRERAFTWNLPGLTNGTITAKELSDYGGWPFEPDLEWMNIQAIAFHHFKSLINKQRFVARRRPGLLERATQVVFPVLEANEEGCDEFHWLDGTVLRFCCDIHDACYEKYGCSASTWWKVWTSWRCDVCNGWVIWCFSKGGLVPPLVY